MYCALQNLLLCVYQFILHFEKNEDNVNSLQRFNCLFFKHYFSIFSNWSVNKIFGLLTPMFINNLNTLHTVPMDLNISILTKYDISNYMEKISYENHIKASRVFIWKKKVCHNSVF